MTLWVDSKYLFGNANWLALQSWPKLGCLLLLRLHLAGLTRLLAVYLPVPLLQNTTLTDATLTMDRNKNRAKVYAWQHLWLQRGLSCIDFPGIPPHLCSHAKPWLKLHRWLKVGSPRSERTSMAQHAKKNVSLLPPSDSTPLKLRVLHLCAAWNPNERGHRNALDMTKNKQRIQKSSQTLLFRSGKTARAPKRRHFVLYGNQSQIRDWISGSLGSLSLNSLAFAIQ